MDSLLQTVWVAGQMIKRILIGLSIAVGLVAAVIITQIAGMFLLLWFLERAN